MKPEYLIIITLSIVCLGYSFGLWTSKYSQPTVEKCLPICVEQFEKWGC